MEYVAGYCIALDMTAREWQNEAKAKGLPWTASKVATCLHSHPEVVLGANPKSISHRCHPILVAFVWELSKKNINLPLVCLQGGKF